VSVTATPVAVCAGATFPNAPIGEPGAFAVVNCHQTPPSAMVCPLAFTAFTCQK